MKKVLIGMSGGVDSSVAAALLKKQGYEVIGATMLLWTGTDGCGGNLAADDAKKVCDFLGIEHRVLDFTDTFKDKVVSRFINEYISGRTPNPCICCNKYLKFGKMLDYALENGIDYVATGHYARIEYDGEKYHLYMSRSEGKDQSYVLYNFTQKQLAHTLMPLADMDKSAVRALAEEMGLFVAKKPDSQEICFVPDDDYARFITEHSDYVPQKGDILDTKGNLLGQHKGLIYYTVGQRKGIGAYGRPMFVLSVNPSGNTIVLGEKGMEFTDSLTASDINFLSGDFPDGNAELTAKIRYQAKPAACTLVPLAGGRAEVKFSEPQRAVTPGQSVVFYCGKELLGGGIVERAPANAE